MTCNPGPTRYPFGTALAITSAGSIVVEADLVRENATAPRQPPKREDHRVDLLTM
jgi:hypothetical protein